MIVVNIRDIIDAPALWLSFAMVGLLLAGGFIFGLLMAVMIRGIQHRQRRKNSN